MSVHAKDYYGALFGEGATIEYVRPCPGCGREHAVRLSTAGLMAWKKGVPIQVALPDLSDDDREALLTGLCASCWDAATDEDGCDPGDDEERPDCGCKFCHCVNTTIAGETCNDCLSGAHQG